MTIPPSHITYPSTIIKLMLMVVLFAGVSACVENRDGSSNTNLSPKVQGVTVDTVANPSVKAPSELSPHAAQLADAVQQSQARLASSSSDVCPKLIEFKVGDTTNFRQNETMRNQYCKYFIYPRKGEKIGVKVSNNNMKAEMVQPKYFNFSNGKFTVTKNGKHVLQISYKNYHGSRPAERYDLTVSAK